VNTAAEIRTIKKHLQLILSPHTRLDILIRCNPKLTLGDTCFRRIRGFQKFVLISCALGSLIWQ
jgi:hypothetical protein